MFEQAIYKQNGSFNYIKIKSFTQNLNKQGEIAKSQSVKGIFISTYN